MRPTVVIGCFDTSCFDTSLLFRGVNSFTYLGKKKKNINPKCFPVHAQTILEVIKIFV